MKKKIIISIAVLVALGAGGYLSRNLWLRYTPWGAKAGLPAGPASGRQAANNNSQTIYTCAMHTQIIRHHPGNCPICGMPLVKKVIPAVGQVGRPASADTPPPAAGQGMGNITSVSLDPRERMLANVATSEAREETISQEIDTVGTIAVNEQKIRKISSRYAGRIERQDVNVTGQYVRKGQELFTIYSPEIVATQKEYLIAKASAARLKTSGFPEIASGTEGVLQAARTRMKLWGLTGAQIKRLDKTGHVSNSV
ncbi:MAG: efflux RND transporter periplasmic adaptor subunit, partial [Nitrospirota bacterium]